jgi:hypothetical protein
MKLICLEALGRRADISPQSRSSFLAVLKTVQAATVVQYLGAEREMRAQIGRPYEANGSDLIRTILWATKHAGFAHISRSDWNYAFSHHFNVTNPVSIDWEYFDHNFLRKMDRNSAAGLDTMLPLYTHGVLLLARGQGVERKTGYFYPAKIDELIRRAYHRLFCRLDRQVSEKSGRLPLAISARIGNLARSYRERLARHGIPAALDQRQTTPTAVSTLSELDLGLSNLLARVQLADLTFVDVLVVYGTGLPRPPIQPFSLADRHEPSGRARVQLFQHIPASELELVLPHECYRVSMRPMDRINFALAAIGGVGVLGTALWSGLHYTTAGLLAVSGVVAYASRTLFKYWITKDFYAASVAQAMGERLVASGGAAIGSVVHDARERQLAATALVCAAVWLHEPAPALCGLGRPVEISEADLIVRANALRREQEVDGSDADWATQFDAAIAWLGSAGLLHVSHSADRLFVGFDGVEATRGTPVQRLHRVLRFVSLEEAREARSRLFSHATGDRADLAWIGFPQAQPVAKGTAAQEPAASEPDSAASADLSAH